MHLLRVNVRLCRHLCNSAFGNVTQEGAYKLNDQQQLAKEVAPSETLKHIIVLTLYTCMHTMPNDMHTTGGTPFSSIFARPIKVHSYHR